MFDYADCFMVGTCRQFWCFNLLLILMLAGPINFTPERTKQLSSNPTTLEGVTIIYTS
jgi:hypothetical protein